MQVGPHDRVPALGGNCFQWRKELPAGIVDEKIQPAEIAERSAHHLAYPLLFTDVGRIDARSASCVRNLARDRLKLFHPATDKGDARAERGEFMGGATSNAATRSGDDPGLP